MIRIGILGHRFIEWGGGIDFLRMVCASLSEAKEATDLHVLVPTRGPLTTLNSGDLALRRLAKRLLGRAVAPSHAPPIEDLARLLTESGATVQVHEIDRGPTALKRASKHLGLDVLLPAFDPVPSSVGVPWVGYLYDTQHKYLPQFFSKPELQQRDRDFERMLHEAKTIVVNARAVAADLQRHFSASSAHIVALPFSTAPSLNWFVQDPASAKKQYGIDASYFIVCNQFWKHKDHQTAFEAFALLAPQYPELSLVCTGATADHRAPHYFDTLRQLLRDCDISHRVHILGLIPKTDQIALMRGAVALIQPTMFEGGPGGGAVYDAVALGVPCVVSDIPVNLELDEPDIRFFRVQDAQSLHEAMILTYHEAATRLPPAPDELVARGRERRAKCGNILIQAAQAAIARAAAAKTVS
jgi:glycosyltransferase involved in cell wall biosynthesis